MPKTWPEHKRTWTELYRRQWTLGLEDDAAFNEDVKAAVTRLAGVPRVCSVSCGGRPTAHPQMLELWLLLNLAFASA